MNRRTARLPKRLEVDDFIVIFVGGDGEDVVLAEVAAGHHIEKGAVGEGFFLSHVVAVSVEAEQQAGELVDVDVEHLCHIIVKLL